MAFIDDLPKDAVLLDVFRANRGVSMPLMDLHEAILRAPDSPFSEVEREMIAVFVSGLNGCRYCQGTHLGTVKAYGGDPQVIVDALEDPNFDGVPDSLRPVLTYARKLNEQPASVTREDADAILAAGWPARAIHDTVAVVAMFNFMNRYVEGLGIEGSEEYYEMGGKRLRRVGYAGLKTLIAEDG